MRFRIFGPAASVGLAVFLGGCSTTGLSSGGERPGALLQAPVAAQVAVYESLFASNASALQGQAASYCIGTGSGARIEDPDKAVLMALRGNSKVKPASACDAGPMGVNVVDRQSRQPALLFAVDGASCSSASECTLYGGYYEGNVSSQRNLYHARRDGGRWNVTIKEQGPIS